MCVNSVLCLIVVPLPPGKPPFSFQLNNNNSLQDFYCFGVWLSKFRQRML
jgi:hypothetical protein